MIINDTKFKARQVSHCSMRASSLGTVNATQHMHVMGVTCYSKDQRWMSVGLFWMLKSYTSQRHLYWSMTSAWGPGFALSRSANRDFQPLVPLASVTILVHVLSMQQAITLTILGSRCWQIKCWCCVAISVGFELPNANQHTDVKHDTFNLSHYSYYCSHYTVVQLIGSCRIMQLPASL